MVAMVTKTFVSLWAINHGTSNNKEILYNSKKRKMGRLLNINCWRGNQNYAIFEYFFVQKHNIFSPYMGIFYK